MVPIAFFVLSRIKSELFPLPVNISPRCLKFAFTSKLTLSMLTDSVDIKFTFETHWRNLTFGIDDITNNFITFNSIFHSHVLISYIINKFKWFYFNIPILVAPDLSQTTPSEQLLRTGPRTVSCLTKLSVTKGAVHQRVF